MPRTVRNKNIAMNEDELKDDSSTTTAGMDAGWRRVAPKRSCRKRAPVKLDPDDCLQEDEIQNILNAFADSADAAPPSDFTLPLEEVLTSNEQSPPKALKKNKNSLNVPDADFGEYLDVDGAINVNAMPRKDFNDQFKISRARSALGRKYRNKTQNETEEDDAECEEETMNADDLQEYMEYKAPRSSENTKFQAVYAALPKLRNASPPRFTTKGVKKKKLKHKELGIRIVGKSVGNPYSGYSKRRNGVIYGNQPLKTVKDLEKYADAALHVKKVLKKQSEQIRLSSYVVPEILAKVKGQSAPHNNIPCKEEPDEGDVDIETVDDVSAELVPEKKIHILSNGTVVGSSPRKGRRPGRTVLECEDCGYKTTHSSHMKIHITCVHRDIKHMECQYEGCGYKCSRKGSMTRHEKCVHRKDKMFKCEKCEFTTAWSISLERHIITKHEKLRPWTCEMCKKSFGQQFTLTTHVNTVHKKVKRIKCAFCSFRAATRVAVRTHIIRVHAEELEKAANNAQAKANGDTHKKDAVDINDKVSGDAQDVDVNGIVEK